MTSSHRLLAIQSLRYVINDKHSLSEISFTHPFVQELVYGTLRWFWKLEGFLKKLLRTPLKEKDSDIHLLLLIGIYQLHFLDIPKYATVNETVSVTNELKKPWAKKLVNAILREYLRKKDQFELQNDTEKYSHPNWFIKKIKLAWPNDWERILNANNERPPFSLRINLLKAKREDYLPGNIHPYIACAITIPTQNVNQLKGFQEGLVSVQDASSQLAPFLLDLKPHQTILDACAAPGGKTAHILETEPKIHHLTAIDLEEKRIQRIEENIKRLELKSNISIINADASKPDDWWDKLPFDRILLDAPCSASGVIRRHPDIKFLRKESDIKQCAEKQLILLNALWPLLKEQGLLLYSTCSLFPEENTQVIEKFLQLHSDAKEKMINAKWGIKQKHGRQILPGMDDMNGFYYACLEKI